MTEERVEQQAVSELESASFVVRRYVRSNTIGKRTIRVDIVASLSRHGSEY